MEELKKCPKCGCSGCEVDGAEEEKEDKKIVSSDRINDNHLAILLALVPAMTMSLFNLMGLM